MTARNIAKKPQQNSITWARWFHKAKFHFGEDITSETALRLIAKGHREACPWPLALTVAKNLMRDDLRRRKSRGQVYRLLSEPSQPQNDNDEERQQQRAWFQRWLENAAPAQRRSAAAMLEGKKLCNRDYIAICRLKRAAKEAWKRHLRATEEGTAATS